MTASPLDDAGSVLDVTVKADGRPVETNRLLEVEIEHRANRIGRAVLVFDDSDPGVAEFSLTDADTFKPGSQVEVLAAYDQAAPQRLFKGIVVMDRLTIGGDNEVRLRVECRHAAVAMTTARQNRAFEDSTDSDVLSKLLRAHGLDASVAATAPAHGVLVQSHATDWDFLLLRAEANGLVVLLDDDRVRVKAAELQSPVLEVTYGTDIVRFDARLDARSQHARAEAATWVSSKFEVATERAPAPSLKSTGPGNLDAPALAKALNTDDLRLQSAAVDEVALKGWAEARQRRTGFARNRAEVTFTGSARVRPGDTLELKNLGRRFSGRAYVGRVTHRLAPGEWLTTVETGLEPWTHAEGPAPLAEPEVAGLAAPARGLLTGIVLKLGDDPDRETRIKVKLPLLASRDGVVPEVWARLAAMTASDGFGHVFLPEIGDEVVLGFLNDDPAFPVVLGALYSSKHAPPYTFQDGNNTKAVVSRANLRLIFDEEKKAISLVTPAGNTLVLDDNATSVSLKDQHGNEVILGPGGITISSPKDIKVTATGKIDIAATQDASVSGANVNASADLGLKATGGASAELSAAGKTTVKGGLVMIN